ncbi:MAG: 6-phosphofructokinase [Candidatus Sumerlaeia bacterium]
MNETSITTFGLLTSGGDSAGMNAAIRAVVRAAIYHGKRVKGIRRGYRGLIDGDVIEMNARSVSGIVNRGGTILLTARCEEFKTREGMMKAAQVIKQVGIDALIVIGGDGSYRGAHELSQLIDIPVAGIPGSIDNDIYGTDYSLGFDTAANVALEAIDRIRDTATSHERLFLIEVMGRHAGFIALWTAIAGGAEDVLLPETSTDIPALIAHLQKGKKEGKISSIVVVAEGDEAGGAMEIARQIGNQSGYEVRVSILGHQQRGGCPTVFDRMLGAEMGVEAVEALLRGERNIMVCKVGTEIVTRPLELAWRNRKQMDPRGPRLVKILGI